MNWLCNRYTGLDDHEFDSDFDEEDRLLPQYAEVYLIDMLLINRRRRKKYSLH